MSFRRPASPMRTAAFTAALAVGVFPPVGGCLIFGQHLRSGEPRASATLDELVVRRDAAVPYARIGADELHLDVFRTTFAPDAAGAVAASAAAARGPLPLLVFVHGGGWMTGRRFDIPEELVLFVERGFVVATIDYRTVQGNRFLANVHDVKAAVRFLRAHADRFGIDPRRIALVGFAAGGHLAALAGLAGGDLEGDVGDHDDVSSEVQALVSFQGPMNLTTILVQRTPGGTGKHRVPVELLLGGPPEERLPLAVKASPIGHVRPGAPPLLLVYGGVDDQVPHAQGREMAAAYARHGAAAELVVIDDAEHKSLLRFDERRGELLADFLDRRLARTDGVVR